MTSLWYYPWIGYGILGTGKKIFIDRFLPWYLEPVTDFGFGYLAAHPSTRAGSARLATAIGRHTVFASRLAWGTRAGLAARAGLLHAGRFAGAAGLAVAAPVAAGYAVSYAIAGRSGAGDFHDFITGGVSPSDWWDTVTLKSLRD